MIQALHGLATDAAVTGVSAGGVPVTGVPVTGVPLTYVTVTVDEQSFALPIENVHDVFVASALTPVPLAPPEVAGLLNLRGRVVTMLDLRARVGLPAGPATDRRMAVGIEQDDEAFGLLVDGVGEVLQLPAESRDEVPIHLREPWTPFATGVHRLPDKLLVVLDLAALVAAPVAPAA